MTWGRSDGKDGTWENRGSRRKGVSRRQGGSRRRCGGGGSCPASLLQGGAALELPGWVWGGPRESRQWCWLLLGTQRVFSSLHRASISLQQGLHSLDNLPNPVQESSSLRGQNELIIHHGSCNLFWAVPIQIKSEGHHLAVVRLQLAFNHSVVLV